MWKRIMKIPLQNMRWKKSIRNRKKNVRLENILIFNF